VGRGYGSIVSGPSCASAAAHVENAKVMATQFHISMNDGSGVPHLPPQAVSISLTWAGYKAGLPSRIDRAVPWN